MDPRLRGDDNKEGFSTFFCNDIKLQYQKGCKKLLQKKYWSNEGNKFIGDPVLTIELESKENQPFY